MVEWRLEPAFLLPHRARPLQPFKNQLMKETGAISILPDPTLNSVGKDASWQMRVLVHTHVNGEKTQCMSSEFPIGAGKIHWASWKGFHLAHTLTARICHNGKGGDGQQVSLLQNFHELFSIPWIFPYLEAISYTMHWNSFIKIKLQFHLGLESGRICVWAVRGV